MPTTPAACAQGILEVVPQIMRAIRTEMRRHRTADLSVPQFRTLGYIDRNTNASLSDVAEHIGLTLPSMSKLIEGLVARQLVSRRTDPADRRRVVLTLTRPGRAALDASRAATRAYLAEALASLSTGERATVVEAMELLRPLFTSPVDRK